MKDNTGILYICPTPIGNLEDITLRCLRILKEVDLIASEDTRVSKKLLNHFQIKTPLISYHKFSEKQKLNILIDKLLEGQSIALISDSGTPTISDPGNMLLKEAFCNKIKIVPLPGACSVSCALSASGLAEHGYIFAGFQAKNNTIKTKTLKSLTTCNLPIVIFESPQRLVATLECIKEAFGSIKVFIGRELTKLNEEILFDNIENLIEKFTLTTPKGEITIIIDKINFCPPQLTEKEIKSLIEEKIKQDKPVSTIAKELSEELEINKNKIYKMALKLSNKE